MPLTTNDEILHYHWYKLGEDYNNLIEKQPAYDTKANKIKLQMAVYYNIIGDLCENIQKRGSISPCALPTNPKSIPRPSLWVFNVRRNKLSIKKGKE